MKEVVSATGIIATPSTQEIIRQKVSNEFSRQVSIEKNFVKKLMIYVITCSILEFP